MEAPKVFISYSWEPIQNKLKVIELAERLFSNGVHVMLDQYDLQEGQDKYRFMEQMVTNPDVIRVLIVCNRQYAERADSHKGGVGVEKIIVSDEVYKKVDQTKFLPIVFEYDDKGDAYVPSFLKGRIYFDLSNDLIFEENYEKLLRNIFNKPLTKRPTIGSMPAYLKSDDSVFANRS